jgi:transposase
MVYFWNEILVYFSVEINKQKGEHSFPGHGAQSLNEGTRRIAELEKRLNDTEIERDILKKALSIISKSGR